MEISCKQYYKQLTQESSNKSVDKRELDNSIIVTKVNIVNVRSTLLYHSLLYYITLYNLNENNW